MPVHKVDKCWQNKLDSDLVISPDDKITPPLYNWSQHAIGRNFNTCHLNLVQTNYSLNAVLAGGTTTKH